MKRLPVFASALLATTLVALPVKTQAFFGFFGGGFSFGVGSGWWGGPGWWGGGPGWWGGGPGWWGPRSWHRAWRYHRPYAWYGRRWRPYWAAQPFLWAPPITPLPVTVAPAAPAKPTAPESPSAK
jgi:hypothetical protein